MVNQWDREYWSRELEKRQFASDSDRALVLLESFFCGLTWLEEKFRSRGLRFISPSILLVEDPNAPRFRYRWFMDGPKIEIALNSLKKDSLQPMGKVFPNRNKHNQLIFRGTNPELYALAGVEEGHHSLRYQFKYSVFDARSSDRTERYHGNPFEFDALMWRIRYAIEHHFSRVDVLKSILRRSRHRYLQLKRDERGRHETNRAIRQVSLSWLRGQGGAEPELR